MKKRWKYVLGMAAVLLLVLLVVWIKGGGGWNRLSGDAIAYITAREQLFSSWNDQIDFYGKVVDQHDRPVEGVKVLIEVTGWNRQFVEQLKTLGKSREQKEGKLVRYSDANGRFTVEKQDGDGLVIDEHSFHKDGYIEPIFHWYSSSRFSYGSFYHEDEKHHPDPDDPVVYHIWKRLPDQGPRGLIKRGVSNTRLFRANGNGRSYDLITGKKIAIDDPRAELILSARIMRDDKDPKEYDWILTLKMKKGGIQKAEDFHLFLAPKDGYQKKIVLKGKSAQSNKFQGGFYLHYKNLIYASIYFEEVIFRPDYGDYGEMVLFRWTYVVNPFGSRNLEYDPYRYEKLEKQRESGELKLSTEEFWKLVDDEDPVRGFDEEELKAIVELLQKGETPKAKDYQ